MTSDRIARLKAAIEAAEVELARVWTKSAVIRAKQAAKPKRSPLPEPMTTSISPLPMDVRLAAADAMAEGEGSARAVEAKRTAVIEAARGWLCDRHPQGADEELLFLALAELFPEDFAGKEACTCGEVDSCDECLPKAQVDAYLAELRVKYGATPSQSSLIAYRAACATDQQPRQDEPALIEKAAKFISSADEFGGCHIVVSDGNMYDDSLEFCGKDARTTDAEHGMLKLLMSMSFRARMIAFGMGGYGYDRARAEAYADEEVDEEIREARETEGDQELVPAPDRAGWVTDGAVDAALRGFHHDVSWRDALPEVLDRERRNMRAALEAAAPLLQPSAPQADAVAELVVLLRKAELAATAYRASWPDAELAKEADKQEVAFNIACARWVRTLVAYHAAPSGTVDASGRGGA